MPIEETRDKVNNEPAKSLCSQTLQQNTPALITFREKTMVMSAWAHLLKGLGWQWVGHFSPPLYEFDEKQSYHPIGLSFLVTKLFLSLDR